MFRVTGKLFIFVITASMLVAPGALMAEDVPVTPASSSMGSWPVKDPALANMIQAQSQDSGMTNTPGPSPETGMANLESAPTELANTPIANAPAPDALSGTAPTPSGAMDNTMSALEKVADMDMWVLMQDDALVEELYELKDVKTEKMNGTEVRIAVRQAVSDELAAAPSAPMTIATISSNGFEVRHPLYTDRRMEFEYELADSKPPLLVIYERATPAGGDGGDLLHLFTLYRGVVRPLGAVSGLEDADADGKVDPYVYDRAFAGGLGLIDPADAPLGKAYFAVEGGKIVRDREKFTSYYTGIINAADNEIGQGRAVSPGSADLVPILRKFLALRAMGAQGEGWKVLEKDVMSYGGDFFPLKGVEGQPPRRVAVEEVISLVRKSVGKGWKK